MIKDVGLLIIGEIHYQCCHCKSFWWKYKPLKCLYCDSPLFKKVKIVMGVNGQSRKIEEVI